MLADKIEHTLLKAHAQSEHIVNLCQQAKAFGFLGVCVNPFWVQLALDQLTDSSTKVVSVVGFPLGATLTSQKVLEAQRLSQIGVDEIDMVINLGALKDGQMELVVNDIRAVKGAISDVPLKVIIETAVLTYKEKFAAVNACKEANADFVKTSTGYADGGATVEDIELIKSLVGDSMKIKASGGIKKHQFALDLIAAGADRLGTSSGVNLVAKEIEVS